MKFVLSKLVASLFVLGTLTPATVSAEVSQPLAGWELGAYFDLYNQSSPTAHSGTSTYPKIVEGRLFDGKTSQTTVSMVELSARRKSGKTVFRIDAAFGDMVDVLAGASTEPTRNITQATVAYSPLEELTLTFGKFYTPIGFETTKAKDNLQYSRSYTFNYAIPLWHQGVSAAYAIIPSKLTGTLYVVNGLGGPISQATGTAPTFAVALGATPIEQMAINYTYMTTSEATTSEGKRDLHDVNLTYNFSSQYAVAYDYTMGSQIKPSGVANDTKWSGMAVYLKAQFGSFYTLSPRYEMFDDSDSGYALAASPTKLKQKLTSLTISNKFDLDPGLEIRVEYRTDKSDINTYFKKADGTGTDSQDTYTVALLYAM
jgi:hypothetical protein